MSIERLTFTDETFAYSPLETSIHMARYQLAKSFVKDKKVLDIACGEGYGSGIMKKWGAKSVLGVDISHEAIEHANENFASDGVEFICSSAEKISSDQKFDLIVSLETIEHVEDQIAYMHNLKNMLADDGILIISCPNDHWYYNEDESNEFHLRKYTFSEFVEVSESVLGEAKSWYLGANIYGYGNFQYNKNSGNLVHAKKELSMMDLVDQKDISASMSYNLNEYLPTVEQCLYYVGIWTKNKLTLNITEGINCFPISPKYISNNADQLEQAVKILEDDNDILRTYVDKLESSKKESEEAVKILKQDNDTLRTYVDKLESSKKESEEAVKILKQDNDALKSYVGELESSRNELNRIIRNIKLQKKAFELENDLAKHNLHKLTSDNAALTSENVALTSENAALTSDNAALASDNAELRIVYNRYQKIRSIIPAPIRRLIVKTVRNLKG